MAAQTNGRGYHSTGAAAPRRPRALRRRRSAPRLSGHRPDATRRSSRRRICSRARGPTVTVGALNRPARQQLRRSARSPRRASRKVSMVRLGSETHAFDQNQRYVPLQLHEHRRAARRAGAGELEHRAARLLHAVRRQRQRRAVDRQVRAACRRPARTRTAPTAPGNLTATGGLGKADLTWTASTDNGSIRRYNVHRSTTPGSRRRAANRVGQPTGTSFTDSGSPAAPTTTWSQAEDQAGNLSTPSAEAHATVTGGLHGADRLDHRAGRRRHRPGLDHRDRERRRRRRRRRRAVQARRRQPRREDTSAPYSVAWDTTAAANGAHTLSAVARDAAGNTRTATTVSVTVSNTGPPPAAPRRRLRLRRGLRHDRRRRSGRSNTGTIAGGAVRTTTTGEVRRRAHLRRRQRPDHGARRQLARPHQRDDARGLGAGRPRAAATAPRSSRRRPANLAYALYSNSTAFGSSSAQRPSGVDLRQRHRRHGGAAH